MQQREVNQSRFGHITGQNPEAGIRFAQVVQHDSSAGEVLQLGVVIYKRTWTSTRKYHFFDSEYILVYR